MEFIDTSLFETTTFKLSYKDPTQKRMIRNHFLKFFQDFPSFIPSSNTFVNFDGTTMNLLNVNGFLYASEFLPEVPLVIWLHESYPYKSPMIFIPSNPECPIHSNHPYIDPSGFVTPPYILDWHQKKSNLCELVHNLVHLFQHDHPSMPSSTLKATILDDLVAKIYDDLAVSDIQNRHEIEKWSNKQAKLQERGNKIDHLISTLEEEHENLENRVVELRDYHDKLLDWVRNNKDAALVAQLEIIGDKSKMVDCKAEYNAIDDVIYALDKALEQGVMSLDVYMKNIRVLAREQFFLRARLLKWKNSRF
ncbi:hypothetical protein BVRB_5g120210 [Beta vulgaris subsp. vulgaris]|nr:hypothetical protein BVRB_5g120210 [Beta vulgaris subsp. vulgaris]